MNKCFNCGADLIWQDDYSFEDVGAEGEGVVTVWLCPVCQSLHEVYIPEEVDDE